MVETPRALLGPDGRCPLPALVAATRGRCVGLHFGVYDYLAALEIAPSHHGLRHPACDHARQVMQVALAGTGVLLSAGSTNVLPVPPRDQLLRAWRVHLQDVRHSLVSGFYHGWDLHPAQLVTRYVAAYTFFRECLEPEAAGSVSRGPGGAARALNPGTTGTRLRGNRGNGGAQRALELKQRDRRSEHGERRARPEHEHPFDQLSLERTGALLPARVQLGEALSEVRIKAREVELIQLAQVNPVRRVHLIKPLHELVG